MTHQPHLTRQLTQPGRCGPIPVFGSFLSGGLAGYVYGSFAAERADIVPAAKDKMWDAALQECG